MGLVVVVLSLGSGCTPCTSYSDFPTNVCAPSSAIIEPGRAFALTATAQTFLNSSVRCDVEVDGGSLSLKMDVEQCPGSAGARPAPVNSNVTCQVPALEAGRYTVTGSQVNFVVNVGGDAGVGLERCP